jgi:hypothetical protein
VESGVRTKQLAAQKRARDLKAEFPMLQIKVYDAAEKKLLELSPTE